MIENIDTGDKFLENEINIELEKASDENTLSAPLENTAPKHENDKMEVHHHPQVEKKNFKEYLLEGLMIFVAVTLGFFAENIREHVGEKKHEKQYIQSFFEDVSSDEEKLSFLASEMDEQIRNADSIILLLPHIDNKTPANNIYMGFRGLIRQMDIHLFVNDRTISELRNSGSMRLIDDKQVSDSIVTYYKAVDAVQYLFTFLFDYKEGLRKTYPEILNSRNYDAVDDTTDRIINPPYPLFLKSTEKDAINKVLLTVSDIRGLSTIIARHISDLHKRTSTLKKFIANKYHLE